MDDTQFEQALAFAQSHGTHFIDFARDRVIIGADDELNENEHEELREYLDALGPWRKGPWRIFGHDIDANWKSHIKWQRVLGILDPLRDKDVCDVGTGNGYYLFRMMHQQPASLLGLDPTTPFRQCFEFLNTFVTAGPNAPWADGVEFREAGYDLLAGEEFHAAFDVILCMGILYHHEEPLEILKILYNALRPGGQLVVESLGLPESYSAEAAEIRPEKGRYAGARGHRVIPNARKLGEWIEAAGFADVVCHGEFGYADEQVATDVLPGLNDNLDPEDPSKTVEGYPAPVRIFFSARR